MAAIDPPTLLPRLLEALRVKATGPGTGESGALLRVLAASRPGGLFMQLGNGFSTLSAWLVDGMDVSSRFIAVVENPSRAANARRCLGGDLRVTVHTQDTAGFLDDVSHHRFDLVLVDEAGVSEAVLRRVPEMLAAGGLLVLAPGDTAALDSLSGFGELRFAHGLRDGDLLIAARLIHGLPKRRRGGRRARRGTSGTVER